MKKYSEFGFRFVDADGVPGRYAFNPVGTLLDDRPETEPLPPPSTACLARSPAHAKKLIKAR